MRSREGTWGASSAFLGAVVLPRSADLSSLML